LAYNQPNLAKVEKQMLALALIFIGAFSRLIFHWPNFTPVISLCLFSGVYLPKKYAVIIPVSLMAVTDLILGWHDTIVFTWGSMLLIAGIGVLIKPSKSLNVLAMANIGSAVLFFLITNFGAWLSLYPLTWEGLKTCYWLALPFFKATFLSTLIYGFIFFGLYESAARRIKKTRYAKVLLSGL